MHADMKHTTFHSSATLSDCDVSTLKPSWHPLDKGSSSPTGNDSKAASRPEIDQLCFAPARADVPGPDGWWREPGRG
eukprot:13225963-Alexandrium_andersonii.AAC.1